MESAAIVVVAVVIALVLRAFVLSTYSIPSGSMEPTLQIGDRIVVDKLSHHLHGDRPGRHRGVLHSAGNPWPARDLPWADLVKRVIGLPGETTPSRSGLVEIDGHRWPNRGFRRPCRIRLCPVPSDASFGLHHPYRIPDGDVYVMGDNRPDSCDSRYWGPIRQSSIVGKAVVRIWPPRRFTFF